MTEKMTIEEVAEFLECTPESVKIAAQEGRIAAIKYGRSWVFMRQAIMDGLTREALQNIQPRTRPAPPEPLGTFGVVPRAEREAANSPSARRCKVPSLG